MKPTLNRFSKRFPLRNKPEGLEYRDQETGAPCVYVSDPKSRDRYKVFAFHPRQRTWVFIKKVTPEVGARIEADILNSRKTGLEDISSLTIDQQFENILNRFRGNSSIRGLTLIVNRSDKDQYDALFENHKDVLSVDSVELSSEVPTVTYKLSSAFPQE